MPTYEYVCKRCGHRVEVVQSLSDEPLKTCGVCGGELRKVFHPAGVLFKGSGFYSTDARGKGKDAEAASSAAKDSSKGRKDGTDGSPTSAGSETGSGSGSGDSTGDRGSSGSTGSGEQGRPASSDSRRASREGTSPKPAKDEG